jgi:hypothetical protein
MSLIDSLANSNVTENSGSFGETDSTTSTSSGGSSDKVIIPNTVAINDLKNKINVSKFDTYKNIKFTNYGG